MDRSENGDPSTVQKKGIHGPVKNKDPWTGQKIEIHRPVRQKGSMDLYNDSCNDPWRAESVQISKGECRDPWTVELNGTNF